MKKLVYSKASLILTGLVLMLSIIAQGALVSEGLGWFARNDRVDSAGMSISVSLPDGLQGKLNSYPVTDIVDTQYTLSYDEEVFSLPTNDPNAIIYTEYKKALAVIITVNSSDGESISLALSASTGLEGVDSADNRISNCIKISHATLNEDFSVAEKTDTSFRFISITDGVASKVSSISLGSFSLTAGENKICFLIEYDESLLEYVSRQILSKDPNTFRVTYSNDIAFSITK